MDFKDNDIKIPTISDNKELYFSQKKTLDTFLSSGAITKAQYDKSLGDLSEKMGLKC